MGQERSHWLSLHEPRITGGTSVTNSTDLACQSIRAADLSVEIAVTIELESKQSIKWRKLARENDSVSSVLLRPRCVGSDSGEFEKWATFSGPKKPYWRHSSGTQEHWQHLLLQFVHPGSLFPAKHDNKAHQRVNLHRIRPANQGNSAEDATERQGRKAGKGR